MTDYQLLKWTAEKLQKELEHKRDDEWHGGTEYQRLIYRCERLEMFREYIDLEQQFKPQVTGGE